MAENRPPYVDRSNSLKLNRTTSGHATISLARLASHEGGHPHLVEEDEHHDVGDESQRAKRLDEKRSHGVSNTLAEAGKEIAEAGLGTLPLEDRPMNDRTLSPIHSARNSETAEDSFIKDLEGQKETSDGPDAKTKEGGKGPLLQDQTNLLPVKQVIVVFLGLSCALFVCLLDQTIVTTALPTLGREFQRADIVSWVGTAYLLTSTAFQPIYSRLSDIFGRKIMLLVGLTIFFFGSLACALAQSMIQLIIFRAIQGVGGGSLITMVMIVVSDVVTLKERGKYQGILGGVVATANSLGPVVGGAIVESTTWRWCFYLNLFFVPIAIAVVIFALPLKGVKGDIKTKLKQVDYIGAATILASSICILMAISWGGIQYPWASAGTLAPLIIGIALIGAFIVIEIKLVSLPVVPMHIFRDVTVSASLASTFLSGVVFYAQLFYLPQYFQVVRGSSPLRSGVLLLPLIIVQTVSSFGAGIWTSKTGDYRWVQIWGFTVWCVGTGMLTTIDRNTSLAKLIGYQILAGHGGGSTFQTSLVAIQASVARTDMAVATGARNFIRMFGGSVALAACSALLNNGVKNQLQRSGFAPSLVSRILNDPTQISTLNVSAAERDAALEAYSRGIHNVWYFLTPCVALCVLSVIFFVKQNSLKREDDVALKAEGKAWADNRKQKRGKTETPTEAAEQPKQ